MKSFTGKTVLITGASSGIGKAFAEKLASQKANLVITARSEESLKSLAKSLECEHGIRAYVFPKDLSLPDSAKDLYRQIKESRLSIDVLINNAGFGKNGDFLSYKMEKYTTMIGLNVTSLVELSYLCLPGMLEKKDCGIINVASASSFIPFPFFSVYSATKWFVLAFSEGLYGEYYDKGVTVTAVCPGGTATNFFKVANPGKADPNMKLDTSEFVVEQALEGFLHRKNYVVVGFIKYLISLVPRFLPRKTLIKMAVKYRNKIHNKN
jgi:uncharacterized protein